MSDTWIEDFVALLYEIHPDCMVQQHAKYLDTLPGRHARALQILKVCLQRFMQSDTDKLFAKAIGLVIILAILCAIGLMIHFSCCDDVEAKSLLSKSKAATPKVSTKNTIENTRRRLRALKRLRSELLRQQASVDVLHQCLTEVMLSRGIQDPLVIGDGDVWRDVAIELVAAKGVERCRMAREVRQAQLVRNFEESQNDMNNVAADLEESEAELEDFF
jgi:hypothetical protein